VTLQVDSSRAFRSRAQVEVLLRAVLGGDEVDETEWLEWKSRLDLTKKSGTLMLAKAILGLANRSVERAARFCYGVGYVVVGAAGANTLHGVDGIDLATVEQGITAYVGSGSDAPVFSMAYHDLDTKRVLVVTVEAPRPGDRIYTPCAKPGASKAAPTSRTARSSCVPARPQPERPALACARWKNATRR